MQTYCVLGIGSLSYGEYF